MSKFSLEVKADGVYITENIANRGWLDRLALSARTTDLTMLPREDERMLDAFAELRELGESGGVQIESDRIFISHNVLSRISDNSADILELPSSIEFTLRMEMDGQLGSPSFSLRTDWLYNGQVTVVGRTGAVLDTVRGQRRCPAPLLRAVMEAEYVHDGPGNLAAHWERLAIFRNALEPDAADPETLPDIAQQCSMNRFLEGLKLRVCTSLAIGEATSVNDFSPLPFSTRSPDERAQESEESDALLTGRELSDFQKEFRERGATPAYRLADGEYLILTSGVMPLAELMSRKQNASVEERLEFLTNPEPQVREAYRQFRRDSVTYDEAEEVMGAAGLEALDEAAVDERFVITIEYRDRVIGMAQFVAPDLSAFGAAEMKTTWMPERITNFIDELGEASQEDLESFYQQTIDALENRDPQADMPTVRYLETTLPAEDARKVIEAELSKRRTEQEGNSDDKDSTGSDKASPSDNNILITETNFDALDWHPRIKPRLCSVGNASVPTVRSTLMSHQAVSLDWAQRSWVCGMPGVLNADEQGLGKTLQTLAFLSWLHTKMSAMPVEYRRPFLIVAPTSLLRNWEAEIELHLHASKFAAVTQLYGSQLAAMRESDEGTDLQAGEAQLNLEWLKAACQEGRGHNHLLLTTYRTAANYHHSLHSIQFSTLVFDEIQNLKNPATITATACRSLSADFRIGLTGTPIENKVQDLWAIMDQISPGSFDSLKAFSETFGDGERASLERLNQRLLEPVNGRPPIGIRRLKEHVASDLPHKRRVLLPALMPEHQATCYDDAREKLASSSRGGALKALHHIRSVSAHPGLLDEGTQGGSLTSASARLQQVVDALDWISSRGERALVFVESRKLQYKLAEYLAARYKLEKVDVINGNTSIAARQKTVQRFQEHLKKDNGFDVLVLGPRAAGIGLTLTAANHVLHVSRWWNPAVEEQCNDRVHRIGQQRGVTIHLPLAIHPEDGLASFDCLLQRLMLRKRLLATDVLAPMGEAESDASDIQAGLEARNDNELPIFETPESLAIWVKGRLENYLSGISTETSDTDEATVVIQMHHPSGESGSTGHVKSNRLVKLCADGPARILTSRTEDSTLVVEIGGAMLSLWPEAVIEPGDQVRLLQLR